MLETHTERPLQELDGRHQNLCWGCGPDNPDGLGLRSFWRGEETVAAWQPASAHTAGPPHLLNGGIIATLLDCHGVITAAADQHRREPDAAATWYATSAMTVQYLRPTPINAVVELLGVIVDRGPSSTTVECTLTSTGKVRARATVTSVPVPASWLVPPAPMPPTGT